MGRSRSRSRRQGDRRRRYKQASKRSRSRDIREHRTRKESKWDMKPKNVPMVMDAYGNLVPAVPQQNLSHVDEKKRLSVYVGNLAPGTTLNELKMVFNSTIRTCPDWLELKIDRDPIVSVNEFLDKGYCFVEFHNSIERDCALSMDGYPLKNHTIRVTRPSGYKMQPGEIPPRRRLIPHLEFVPTEVPDTPDKVFLGNIPNNLESTQVMKLVSTMGPIKAFYLIQEKDTNKGYAFFTYKNPAHAKLAVRNFNGMKFVERELLCQFALEGRQPIGNSDLEANPAVTTVDIGLGMGKIGYAKPDGRKIVDDPFAVFATPTEAIGVGISKHAAEAKDKVAPFQYENSKSTCICVCNVIIPEELIEDMEYRDIKEEITEEVSKIAKIKRLEMPRPIGKNRTELIPGVGKVYIRFHSHDEAKKVLTALQGRKFSNRCCCVIYYNERLFKKGKYFD